MFVLLKSIFLCACGRTATEQEVYIVLVSVRIYVGISMILGSSIFHPLVSPSKSSATDDKVHIILMITFIKQLTSGYRQVTI